MSTTVYKCPSCGYHAVSDDADGACDICTTMLRYFCNACHDYSDVALCSLCADRLLFENRVRDAIKNDNLEHAIYHSKTLVAKYPYRAEYGNQQRLLLLAKERLGACSVIGGMPLDTSVNVQQARDVLQQATLALRNADIKEPPSIAACRERIDEAAEELIGLERVKQQMIQSIGRALFAAVLIMLVWSLGHMFGTLAGARVATGEDPFAAYLWTRNGLLMVACGALVAFVARRAWDIPGPLVAVIMFVVFGLLLLLIGALGGYWPGLVLMSISAGTMTWLFETGLASGVDKSDPIRVPIKGMFSDVSEHTSGGVRVSAIVIVLVICLAAPGVDIPSPQVEAAEFERQNPVQSEIASVTAPIDDRKTRASDYGRQSPVVPDVERATPGLDPRSVLDVPDAPSHSVESTISGLAPAISPPVDHATPTISIKSTHPPEPVVGYAFVVTLDSEGSTERPPTYQYRTAGTLTWRDVPKSELKIPIVDEEPLEYEFRAYYTEANPSLPLSRTWKPTDPIALVILNATPSQPIATASFRVELATSDPADDDVWYEYRWNDETVWSRLEGNLLRIDSLPEGELTLDVRIGDRPLAKPIRRSWQVRDAMDFPLELTLQREQTGDVYVADTLTFQAECKRPSPHLVYKFRVLPDKKWTDSSDGLFTIDVVSAGITTLQYGVVDPVVGDHSQLHEISWQASRPRYQVEAIEFVSGKLTAKINDSRLNIERFASPGGQFGEFKVLLIKVDERRLLAANSEGKQFSVPILSTAVDQYYKVRTKARHTARETGRNATATERAAREAQLRARQATLARSRGR